MPSQSRPLLHELAERMEVSHTCWLSLRSHVANYHAACADMDWVSADQIRMVLIETLEAALDATAAVFKKLDQNGQATNIL